jgi:hypothetical protein
MLPKSVAVLPCHLGWRTLLKCNKTNHACLSTEGFIARFYNSGKYSHCHCHGHCHRVFILATYLKGRKPPRMECREHIRISKMPRIRFFKFQTISGMKCLQWFARFARFLSFKLISKVVVFSKSSLSSSNVITVSLSILYEIDPPTTILPKKTQGPPISS